jgi:hypothetical protein
MDRRDFVSLIGSIPFISPGVLTNMDEKDIERIEPLDDTTAFVIKKSQAYIEAFLTGFKNVKFTLIINSWTNTPYTSNPPQIIELFVDNYSIHHGVAKMLFKPVKIQAEKSYINAASIACTFNDSFVKTFDVSAKVYDGDSVEFDLTFSITC